MSPEEHDAESLAAIKKRREYLREAMVEVERAVTSAGAADHADEWFVQLREVLPTLRNAFDEHVEITEDPGGLFEEILGESPRLANEVKRLVREHAEMDAALRKTVDLAEAEDDVAATREQALVLLAQIVQHRLEGADLIYSAYAVDIGGG